MSKKTLFRIRDAMRGSYYRGECGIGPMFGAKFADAKTFERGEDAMRVWSAFPMTVLADIVNDDKKPCDVTGKPLRGNGAQP